MQSYELKYPRLYLIVGIIGFFVFAMAAILSNVFSNGTETWWTTTGFILFSLIGLYLIVFSYTGRHKFDSNKITYGNLPKKITFFWHDIKHIEYSDRLQYFTVKTHLGKKFYFSLNMMSIEDFCLFAIKQVDKKLINETAYQYLEILSKHSKERQ